ncbi:hypothetical protein [Lysobacter sp. 1R34A]|uniref:hypothetical protein n=1 Tax=Lysobacter sp. 1R34A TaxID=3445786 RepID=UPI003EF07771
MKVFRSKRIKLLMLASLFAAGIGFGVAQADSPYREGCPPKVGCKYGGQRIGCCLLP